MEYELEEVERDYIEFRADMLKKDISKEEHIEMMFCAFGKSKCITA